jgi:hypothetical protein
MVRYHINRVSIILRQPSFLDLYLSQNYSGAVLAVGGTLTSCPSFQDRAACALSMSGYGLGSPGNEEVQDYEGSEGCLS